MTAMAGTRYWVPQESTCRTKGQEDTCVPRAVRTCKLGPSELSRAPPTGLRLGGTVNLPYDELVGILIVYDHITKTGHSQSWSRLYSNNSFADLAESSLEIFSHGSCSRRWQNRYLLAQLNYDIYSSKNLNSLRL